MTSRKSLSKTTRFEVFKRDKFTCQYCGSKAPDVILHVDHITPVAANGTDELLNLVTSCAACNLGKGARLLADDTAVAARRGQLEELQERREQLEMMLAWQRDLLNVAQDETRRLAEFWNGQTDPYMLSEVGEQELTKLIRKYGATEVVEAMRISFDKLVCNADGNVTPESFDVAWGFVRAVCITREREKDKPHLRELNRIRARIRGRIGARRGYFDNGTAMQLLESAYAAGVEIVELDTIAGLAKNWTDWKAIMVERACGTLP